MLKTLNFYWCILIFVALSSCSGKNYKAQINTEESKNLKPILHSEESTQHSDYSFLLGKWKGDVMTNSSDPSGGGQPTLGETGTEVQINLFKNDKGIEGTLDIGQVRELWQFTPEQHIWSDNNIKVHTQAVKAQHLPSWIKKRISEFKYTNLVVFKFLSCHKIESSDTPCELKKDLPIGIVNNGVWVFMAEGENLYVNVYYKYPSGGQRILEQKLSRR